MMRLKHSLYSLKDAARILHNLLKSHFAEAVLTQLNCDPSVFQNDCATVICYVNDLLIFSPQMAVIGTLKKKWEMRFVL